MNTYPSPTSYRITARQLSELSRFVEFGRLSFGIFHDLMNLLQGVIIQIDYLGLYPKKHPRTLPESRKLIEHTIHASRRLGSYLETVRKHARLELSREYFSVSTETQDILELIHSTARARGVTLTLTIKHDVFLYGDPVAFHRIIMNLLFNAIDASSDVSKTTKKGRSVFLTIKRIHSSIVISVKDSGIGMTHEILTQLFTPFFTTKKSKGGTGLGLVAVKNLVEQEFKGTISVTSTQGKGATFTVTLPEASAPTK